MSHKSKNAVAVWDFTISSEDATQEQIKNWLVAHTKAWTFQKESGVKTGYIHYQGRFSLKVKVRTCLVDWQCADMSSVHLRPTSDENKDNMFYVMKEDTRIEGPWTDEDKEIPEDIKGLEYWPWQDDVIKSADVLDTRHINIIADHDGNIGKTVLVKKACSGGDKRFRKIPATIEKAEDLMQWVCSFEPAKCYFFDLPRSMNQLNLRQLYTAIEEIKGGYAYDKRYHGKEMWFTSPQIWVFCNEVPKKEYLSKDRWVFWKVHNRTLIREDMEGKIY